MKSFSILLLFCCGLVLAGFGADHKSVAAAAPAPQAATVSCSSDDMRRHYCEADTRGGVQIIRQRSEAACQFGSTWGYDGRGIWVDRGCRADFQVGVGNWRGWGQSYTIYCASDDMGRTFCPTETRNGVRLARQRSDAECSYGRTWGYTRRGIWVDRGCRADFELGGSDWNGSSGGQVVTCSSDDMRVHFCRADASSVVRLIRQRSDADCIYGTTWGYDDRGIWVDRGCRADFALGGDNDDSDDPLRVYCASDDMARHYCATGRNASVRLIRQRSDAPCSEGRTWGSDRRGIWVDRGCRAEFEVAAGRRGGWGGGGGGRDRDSDQGTIYCASDDMRRHYCTVDTRRGVQLVRKRSEADCVQGRTWGYDNKGIWVDRGCRADFQVGANRY